MKQPAQHLRDKPARYDSIIIGAGHNGLVCAAYLARSGQRVLVLEASDSPGGLAANREFHPGFHASVAHSISHFSQKICSDLELVSHGFESTSKPLPTVGLSTVNEHVVVHTGSLSGTSGDDADAYQDYSRLMHRFADALKPFWLKTMPRIGSTSLADLMTFAHVGLNIRRLRKKDVREFMRIASLPARDLMDEYFDDDILKATLSWDGLIGAKLAPRSPNSAVLVMLYRMAGESRGAHAIPASGINGLIEALSASVSASGGEIRCAAKVDRVLIDASANGLRANGVKLSGGEIIHGDRVISATDPQRTFLDLVGVEHLDIGFTNRIRRLRCDGYVAKLHLALDGLPEFSGLDQADGRMIIAPDMDAIEFAFDDAKYGNCPANPVMEIVVPSLHDASLAPNGQHVLSAHVMYVPYKLKGGWTDATREQMCERAIDTIAQYAPRIREQILHKEFLTPADLEQNCHVTGGHWHHTEFAMDQMLMMRPTYEAAQYSTPIPGLHLCAAGCHPGGDITGAAGHNAAHEILR
ncbi:MAG: NAD(P)/FAD-dependent oxidoreductase [Gammaproteobacteria bacterium]|nr:NAD(P)/FAD-dependent oxidoreductase [Gammaproteobacteria bacterium]